MITNSTKTITTIAIIVLLSLTACGKNEPSPQPATPADPQTPSPTADTSVGKLGAPAAKLEGLTWIKGEPVTFQPNKVYVVEFWATWCGPCKISIPHLTEIQKKYKEKGVTIIGISDEADEVAKVKKFVANMGSKMDYTVAVDTVGTVGKGYMTAYRQEGIPTAFIVDKAGKVVWVGHPMDGMDEVLPQVVAGTFDLDAYAKAKAEREALLRQTIELAKQYTEAVLSGKPVEQTRPLADKVIEKAPSTILDQLSWWILTSVEESKRDYPTALKVAEKANTLTEGKDVSVLDTYALALFTNGKIAEAVTNQTKAVELAGDNEAMAAELKGRLEKFKAALPK